MTVIKSYCGLMIIQANGVYYCVDCYTMKVKIKGTLCQCERYMNKYMNNIMERV